MKIALALTILAGACSLALAAPKPLEDSLRAECPDTAASYPLVAAPDAKLAELRAVATRRLAALKLEPLWRAREAKAFADTPADRQRLQRLLSIVLPALERHPAALYERVQVRRIELVKDLVVAGQRRLAMPAPERDSVVYADNGHEVLCLAGMELRTHHELYHVIEHRLFKDFYYRDPQWIALNPPGLDYGQGGATAYGKGFQNLGHPGEGLVSRYAKYGSEEDKAEVFGWLMTPGYTERFASWVDGAEADAPLRAKRDFMRALLLQLSGREGR